MKLLILIIPFILNANIIFEQNNYVRYLKGSLPIIISAPHGGKKNPKSIENRTYGKTRTDKNTDILATLIAREFHKQTNKYPYTIILDLSRKKLDANREIKEAAQGNKESSSVYFTFHNYLNKSKKEVNKYFKKGIFIEIHGHSHPNNYIEIGYLLSNEILKLSNKELIKQKNKSSIKNLSHFSKENFVSQLKGKNSLSAFMDQKGYNVIPSLKIPYAKDNNYFRGGYNLKKYGSFYGGNIVGIQIEFPRNGFRDTKKNMKKIAKDLVDSLIEYTKINFNINLRTN